MWKIISSEHTLFFFLCQGQKENTMTTLSRIYGAVDLLSPAKRSSSHVEQSSSPVNQGSIPVCTILAPLHFMQYAGIEDLKGPDFWKNVVPKIKKEIPECNTKEQAIKMINRVLHEEDEHILPPTEFIKRLDGHDKVPAYEVFVLYIIAVYYSNKRLAVQCNDNDCKNKLLDFLREKIMDQLNTREQYLTENEDRLEDTELTYFKKHGMHKNEHFPPFLLHEVIGLRQRDLDAALTWVKFIETEAGKKVISFMKDKNLQSKIVEAILKHSKKSKHLGCKGGMMLVQYVGGINQSLFFRHAVCFTIEKEQIHMHDTLGGIRKEEKFDTWFEKAYEEGSEKYDAKYILGVYALFHAKGQQRTKRKR